MTPKNHKPQVKTLDISGQTTNNDYSLTANVELDTGFDRVIGISVVQASKSFANYSDTNNISEYFELTLNHDDGEICKSLPLNYLEFDQSCPLDKRFFWIDPKEAKGKRIDIVLKKTGTAKDLDSAAIGGTVTSTYEFKLVLLLDKTVNQ